MNWRPAHEAHAIERATLTFSFHQEVPAKALHDAVGLVATTILSQGFQPSVPSPPNNVFIVSVGAATPVQPQIEGRGFQIVRGGELIEELVFQRGYVAYTTTRYTRWKTVVERVAALAGTAIIKLMEVVHLSSLKVEYYDRFVFEGEKEQADFSTAIRENSKFVPRFHSGMSDLWHSHVGFFVTTPGGYQRLINANVDVLDVVRNPPKPEMPRELRRSIGVYTMSEDRFFVAGSPTPPGSIESIFTVADEMHFALKDILREIISPALAEAISLDPKET